MDVLEFLWWFFLALFLTVSISVILGCLYETSMYIDIFDSQEKITEDNDRVDVLTIKEDFDFYKAIDDAVDRINNSGFVYMNVETSKLIVVVSHRDVEYLPGHFYLGEL